MGIIVAIGAGLGLIVGTLFGKPGFGAGIGAALGVFYGALLSGKNPQGGKR